MSASHRGVALGVLAGAAALLLWHAPWGADCAGIDVWNAAEVRRGERTRERRIEDDWDELTQRIAAGDAVAIDVIENRLALNAAVDRIAEINRGRPHFVGVLQARYGPAASERELYERYLLEKIHFKLLEAPAMRGESPLR